MKLRIAVLSSLLLVSAILSAQVASHTPTVFPQSKTIEQPKTAQEQTVALTAVGSPVARVNGSILTDVDLVREEYSIFPYARQHNGLPKEMAPQIRDGAMKMIIFEELVYQEALRRQMSVSSVKMERAETDFRKQFATSEEFNALLQSEFHGSQQALRQKIRRSLLIESLLRIEIDSKSAVSPAEARAYYDKNPARFMHPELFTFQTISVLPPAKATANQLSEGRKRAEDALRQAKATKSAEEFGLLAEKISDDDYRVMMGQHKPIATDKLAPQVLKALVAMKPGDVSDIIPIEQAYTIVRLQDHTPAGKAKFEEERQGLEKELQKTKTNQLRTALDAKLRKNARIEEM